jgi:hypothetical protein
MIQKFFKIKGIEFCPLSRLYLAGTFYRKIEDFPRSFIRPCPSLSLPSLFCSVPSRVLAQKPKHLLPKTTTWLKLQKTTIAQNDYTQD